MEKRAEEYRKNKKQKTIKNEKIIFNKKYFPILKFSLAAALLLVSLSLIVSAGDVVVESGKLDVSGNLFVDDTGNVGIGTLTPAQKLDVVGQIHASGDICTDAGGGVCLSTGGGSGGGWTDDGTIVRLTTSTDKVGIGTINSDGKLNIASDSGFEIYGHNGVQAFNIFSQGNMVLLAGIGKELHFGSNNIDSQMVLQSGNVGIGTTSPGVKLHVAGANAALGVGNEIVRIAPNNPASTDVLLAIGTNSGSPAYAWIRPVLQGGGFGNIALAPDGGNVGIGTTGPGAKLDVGGNFQVQSDGDLVIKQDGTNRLFLGNEGDWTGGAGTNGVISSYQPSLMFATNNNAAIRMTIDSTGNVGIGTTSPQSALQINDGAGESAGQYLQIDSKGGNPPASDCNSNTEVGRMIYSHDNNRLWICDSVDSGWLSMSVT